MALLDQVIEFFGRHGLEHTPGLIAVSGGPDSVALAHVAATAHWQVRIALTGLAHLNHQLRGNSSDADEEFVRGLPAQWQMPGLTCLAGRVDVARRANETGDNLENAARQARYAWLAEAARRHGASWVATGHTADDQAETVLHHLVRGSGLQGLSGMPERRTLEPGIELVRPLLSVRRHDVHAYLAEHRLDFRRDASNDDARFTRNRLRHDLLPFLETEFNPAVVEVLGRTALQFRHLQTELSRQAAELLTRVELPRAGSMIVLQREPMAAATTFQVRELLRLVWQREGWPQGAMGYDDWQRAALLLQGAGGGQDFPDGVQIRAQAKVVQLERRSGSTTW